MKILITGATGLVGKRLIEGLLDHGYTNINVLTRNIEKAKKESTLPVQHFAWNIDQGIIDEKALQNVDIVFNLAGENIADGRWSDSKKRRILSSRTQIPKLLWNSFARINHSPKKFISSSAVGIYGDRQDESITLESELSPTGDDFLGDVCKKWEEAVHNKAPKETECYSLRTGVVLSSQGGALTKMLPAFKAGVAGRLGTGQQYMSWVHIDDLISQFIFIMENEIPLRYLNGVSPAPVTNIEFTQILGKILHRPTLFPVPAFALKLIFGEMSSVLLKGQKVIPQEWEKLGFKFQYPELTGALGHILEQDLNGEFELLRYQYIPRQIEHVFDFFSKAENLEEITPKSLNFKIISKSTSDIQTDTKINYKLKVHGIPMNWQGQILDYRENECFIDDQLKGPYKKWYHRHNFIAARDGGTIIRDRVTYKLPFGILGSIVAGWLVTKDVQNIFKYRFKIVEQKFNQTT